MADPGTPGGEPVTQVIGLAGLSGHNLGSHLMALAVREAKPMMPLGIPARVARRGLRDLLEPAEVWLWSDVGFPTGLERAGTSLLAPLATRAVSARGRTIRPHRLSSVLDISGYSYGAAFSPATTRRLPVWLRQRERRGVPTVLLPQSFGPFPDAASARAVREALAIAARVYARDDVSADALADIAPRAEIRRAPDIAIGPAARRVVPEPGSRRAGASGEDPPYVLMLPNRQVLRKTATSEDAYLSALLEIGRLVGQQERRVVVASTEGKSDLLLAERLVAGLRGARLERESGVDDLLALVRGASAVVSSRYHGLVAALANEVPVLSVGWAAKYGALLGDFDVPEMSVDVAAHPDLAEACVQRVELLLDAGERLRERIGSARGRLLGDLDRMWVDVAEVTSARTG